VNSGHADDTYNQHKKYESKSIVTVSPINDGSATALWR